MSEKINFNPQELAKMDTELKIIKVLTDEKNRIRWKDLLEKTGISSRTLAQRLKELSAKGEVRRIVDTNVYPPAVYYEASSSAYLTRLPLLDALDQIGKTLENWQQTRKIIETGESNPEKLIENLILEYVWDLFFTLNYSVEDVENPSNKTWPHFVFYHVKAYESRLMELIRVALKSQKLRDAIKSGYQNFKREREKEGKELMDQVIAPFKDQELAKPLMREYCVLLIQGLVKKPYDFEKQLFENKKLREKIEKDFGEPISDEQLRAFMADPGWKVNRLVKSNVIEQIEKS